MYRAYLGRAFSTPERSTGLASLSQYTTLHLCWPAFSDYQFLSWLPYSRPSEAAQDTRFKKYEDYMNVEEEVLKNQAALRMESKQVVMVRAHCGTSHPAYYRCPGILLDSCLSLSAQVTLSCYGVGVLQIFFG